MSSVKFIFKHTCETSVEFTLDEFLVMMADTVGDKKVPLTPQQVKTYTKLFKKLSARKDQRVVTPFTLGENSFFHGYSEFDDQIKGWCEDKTTPKSKSMTQQWRDATAGEN